MVFRTAFGLFAFVILASSAIADGARVCGTKSVCGDMTSCAEAVYFNQQCGLSDLDRDHDGIPCEKICGSDAGTMKQRLSAQPFVPAARTAQLLAEPPAQTNFTCEAKHTCKQMTSCQEATFYLTSCGAGSLDRDGDGVPCEGLCR
jgi:hypothetical protein